jgi:hypothetical protein
MPPKNAKNDSKHETDKGKLSQNQNGRVLRGQSSGQNPLSGSLPALSNERPKPDTSARSEGNTGTYTRPRKRVYPSLETRRQQFIGRLQAAQKAVEISNFDQHLRNRTRAKDLDESDQDEIIAEAEKAVGKRRKFDRNVRIEAHEQRVVAASLYEDFLYYQTPEYRNNYLEHIDKDKGKDGNAMRKGQPPALLGEDDSSYDKELRPIIESFERDGVGMTEEAYQNIGPDFLHVRVPRPRTFAQGLGRPVSPPVLSPMELDIDIEAIEKRRREVEDVNDDPEMSESHSERRVRESELLSRPRTGGYDNQALPTAKDLSRTRLESGLFIAAGETWNDWDPSYDHLDLVAPGRIVKLPAKPTSEVEEDEIDEFCEPQTTPVQYDAGVGHHHIEVTPWAEAADGRRERDSDEAMYNWMSDDDEDSSDDENDLFALSYRKCSTQECPCGVKDKCDGGHGGDDERNSDPSVPVSVAGGPLV